MNYFEMLNAPTFPYLFKYFWVRVIAYHESFAAFEEKRKIFENGKLKGKSMDEMGLEKFKKVEIRSALMGVNVAITQSHIAKLMKMENIGRYALNIKDNSPESGMIKQQLFPKSEDYGKVKNMNVECVFLFRILIGCFILREGSTNHISWDHKPYFPRI